MTATNSSLARFRRTADAALVVLFVILLGVPTLRNLAGSQPATANENRALAPKPVWKWRSLFLKHFPDQFEAFYNDHFGFRHKLIDALNNVRVHWLRSSSSPQVCLGKNGWLYFEHEPLGNDFTTQRAFTPDELLYWKLILEVRRDWLKELGIPYVFVIAPDKQSIYPEMLPRVLRRRHETSRLDQLLLYLKANSDVEVVDLRELLRRAKENHTAVYFATDSHWTQVGAFVAYHALIAELAKHFPTMQPAPRSDFLEARMPLPGGDLARMLGLPNQMLEEHTLLIPRTPRLAQWFNAGVYIPHYPPLMQPMTVLRPGPELPRAVFFHDSFSKSLLPFLGEHFQRMSCRWLEPYQFDYALIAREKPDIVIQQIVERKLGLPLPSEPQNVIPYSMGPVGPHTMFADSR